MLSIAIEVVAVAYAIVDKTGVNSNNSNMTSVDLIRSCLDSIRQISDEVSDAIVYLDAGCLEAFRFIGAFLLLLELGVYAVCSLEDSSPLDIAREAMEAFSECDRPNSEMILGGTSLLTLDDMFELLLDSSSYL